MTPPDDNSIWNYIYGGFIALFGFIWRQQDTRLDKTEQKLDAHIENVNENFARRDDLTEIKDMLRILIQRKD